MKIIKKENQIIDIENIDSCNNNVEFLKKTHNTLNEEYIENYCLLPKLNIQFILKQMVNKNIEFKFCKYAKNKYSLQLFDNDEKQKTLKIICPQCKQSYSINQKNHLLRRKHLLCKNCSLSFAQKNGGVDNYRKTFFEKYGTTSPVYVKQFLEKSKKTCKERYGVQFPLQKQQIRQKIKKTCLQKYGFENPFQSQVLAKKAREGMSCFSNICCECMKRLQKDLNVQIQYGENQKVFVFENGWYRTDGYIEEKNFSIQFYGDYYHANPKFYKNDYVFDFWGKKYTAQQIWIKDQKRLKKLIQKYKMKIFKIWQFDYKTNYEQILKELRKELDNV